MSSTRAGEGMKGTLEKRVVDGCAIALVRRDDGVFAIEDRCPHAGGPLSEGWVEEDGTVRCPWHERHFDPRTGACTDQPKTTPAVRTFPVTIDTNGAVSVRIASES